LADWIPKREGERAIRNGLRYCLVVIAAAAAVVACLLLVPDRTQPSDGSSSDTGRTDFYESTHPGDDPSASGELTSSDEASMSESETIEESGDPDSSETETETVIPTETEEPTVITQPEDTAAIGLYSYFKGMLTIDTGKVSEFLRVREKPEDGSRVITGLYASDIVPYTWVDGKWLKVTKDGVTGYVRGEYVLLDHDCMNAWISSVNYRVVVKSSVKEAFFYEKPDSSSSIIDIAKRYRTYQIVGMDTEFFEIYYHGTHYEKLYVKQSDVILFYEFTGKRGAENRMEAWEMERFALLDISGNQEKAEIIAAESAMEESRIQASIQASIQESLAEEERKKAEAEAKRQAAIERRYEMAKRDGVGIMQAKLDFIPSRFSEKMTAYVINLCKKFGFTGKSEYFGVDYYIVIFALIRQESNFKQNDQTGSGKNISYGLMQIIPRFHKKRMEDYAVTEADVMDTEDGTANVLIGMRILSDYMKVDADPVIGVPESSEPFIRALMWFRYGSENTRGDYDHYLTYLKNHIKEWQDAGYSFEYRVTEY